MDENGIHRKIDSLRKEESKKILKFLLGLAVITFFVLVLLIGFFGEIRAWQLYFFSIFMLVLWLAFRLLELEVEIGELKEKLKAKP